VKIAYLIQTYKDPELLYRMINALTPSGDFYVYVDKKTNIKPFVFKLKNYSNVKFINKRRRINWAGFSVVQSFLDLLNYAYNQGKKYDRFVFLTGQDYPLMTNEEILDYFSQHNKAEFVMAYNINNSPIATDKNKVTKKWWFDTPFKNRFLSKCYKSFFYRFVTKPFVFYSSKVRLNGVDVDPYFGQMLSAFTRKGAELLLNVYLNDKVFNNRMKHAHAPDEMYWQTVIFNSHLRKNTVQNGEEHEITEHFGWAPLHYHNYDVDTSVYTKDDFDELKSCGYMFCRKVVSGISDELMDLIDDMRKEKEKQ